VTRPTLSPGRSMDGPSRVVTRSWRTTDMTDNGSAGTVRWLGLTEAAAALGVSVRTVQRRVKTGELEHQDMPGGRVSVAVRTDATDGGQAADELVHLRTQVDTTNRMTAALVAMAEREGKVLADRVRQTEAALVTTRRHRTVAWTAAAVFAVVAGVTAGVSWTTSARVAEAEERLLTATAAEAAARKDAEHLRQAVAVLSGDLADAMAGCVTE
jgi:hypothetical protein